MFTPEYLQQSSAQEVIVSAMIAKAGSRVRSDFFICLVGFN
jgi:hypothetical protein